MRTFMIGGVTAITICVCYLLFIVWSYCEALKNGGANTGVGLPLLREGARIKSKFRPYQVGLFGTGCPMLQGSCPSYYGSLATPGIGGNTRIFNGRDMETDYPPPQKP